MNPEYTSNAPPTKLIEYLERADGTGYFRRRAVLVAANGEWGLLCCSVEWFFDAEAPASVPSRQYENAVLYEDTLSAAQCRKFVAELCEGFAEFGDQKLMRDAPTQWSTQIVPLNNDCMARAGLVVGLRVRQTGVQAHIAPLLSPDQPYYPDIEEAARNWLPFRVYHGHRDGRNDQILFLLPEVRAFVSDVKFPDDGTLEITVAGTLVGRTSLIIKGAYWEGTAIRHFEAPVQGAICTAVVPAHTERLEYYLIDQDGTVFDFHREDRFASLLQGRKTLGPMRRSLSEQIRAALHLGEGQRTEFKPFIEPEQQLGSSTHKTKLRELVTTVVAFANTQGGHVYIGVDDNCNPVGIDQHLAAWAKAPVTERNINQYLGALKSRVKDFVHGDVEVQLSYSYFDSALIVIVEVPPAAHKPVAVLQDAYLYARTGASNRKVSPELWETILDRRQTDALWLSSPQ